MCISPVVSRRLRVLGVLHPLWLLLSFHLIFLIVPEELDGDIPFRFECSQVSHSLHNVWLWICIFFSQLLQEEVKTLVLNQEYNLKNQVNLFFKALTI